MSEQLITALIDRGTGALIAFAMLFIGYKLFNKHIVSFIDSQKGMAGAMQQQAKIMTNVQQSIQSYVVRDNDEHRELMIMVKVLIRDQKDQAETNELEQKKIIGLIEGISDGQKKV